MTLKYVIVQAGGKGTRMGHLTENKPKCLVSIREGPMLYSLVRVFKDCVFYVIIDYKADVVENYMKKFPPPFRYETIMASGKGTCSGIKQALDRIPDGEQIAILWSDLYFESPLEIPKADGNYIGLTNKLRCRWRFDNGRMIEDPSTTGGVLGVFFFKDKRALADVPTDGEFVKFLTDGEVALRPLMIDNVIEVGTLADYRELQRKAVHSRFFTVIKMTDDLVIKEPLDEHFKDAVPDRHLMRDEVEWYRFVMKHGFKNIAKVHSFNPLTMDRIQGVAPHHMDSISEKRKEELFARIMDAMESLHGLGTRPVSKQDITDVYIKKTIDRLEKARPIIPNNTVENYVVNGKNVRNLLNPKHIKDITTIVERMKTPEKFTVIHGDPTFSNTIIEDKTDRVVFIDPRGYFGGTKVYGDPIFDYAKLYYSAIGNYDTFNERDFQLHMNGNDVNLILKSSGWEHMEKMFESRLGGLMNEIKIVHALTWLSFAGYVVDDIDSMMGAYFRGLELFEEAWDRG